MRLPLLSYALIGAVVAAAGGLSSRAQAQTRVQAPTIPPAQQPGINRPNIDPASQANAALKLQLDALRQSVGRQIVVLNFPPEDSTSWADADNNFPKNTQRGEAMCIEALGDRYGRVVSRKAEPILSTGRWYFPNLVCETKP